MRYCSGPGIHSVGTVVALGYTLCVGTLVILGYILYVGTLVATLPWDTLCGYSSGCLALGYTRPVVGTLSKQQQPTPFSQGLAWSCLNAPLHAAVRVIGA